MRIRRSFGFTLIEIIVTLVVIAIAATALLSVYTSMVRGSADPMIQQQATTIAEAYLEEISLRAFNDPQGGETGADEGESGRAEYDDVKDYRDLASGPPADQYGVLIPALSAYTVTLSITDSALNTVPSNAALRIEVSVDHAAIDAIMIVAYRANLDV